MRCIAYVEAARAHLVAAHARRLRGLVARRPARPRGGARRRSSEMGARPSVARVSTELGLLTGDAALVERGIDELEAIGDVEQAARVRRGTRAPRVAPESACSRPSPNSVRQPSRPSTVTLRPRPRAPALERQPESLRLARDASRREPAEAVRLVADREAHPVRGRVVEERLGLGDLRAEVVEREREHGLAHQPPDPATLELRARATSRWRPSGGPRTARPRRSWKPDRAAGLPDPERQGPLLRREVRAGAHPPAVRLEVALRRSAGPSRRCRRASRPAGGCPRSMTSANAGSSSSRGIRSSRSPVVRRRSSRGHRRMGHRGHHTDVPDTTRSPSPGAALLARIRAGETLFGAWAGLGSPALGGAARPIRARLDRRRPGARRTRRRRTSSRTSPRSRSPEPWRSSGRRPRSGCGSGARSTSAPPASSCPASTRPTRSARRSASSATRRPVGRGVALLTRGGRLGAVNHAGVAALNDDIVGIVQIESPSALEAADEIASIDGVDVLFVGPADLSHSLGIPGQFAQRALPGRAAAASSTPAGRTARPPGSSSTTHASFAPHLALGYTFVGLGADNSFVLDGARAALQPRGAARHRPSLDLGRTRRGRWIRSSSRRPGRSRSRGTVPGRASGRSASRTAGSRGSRPAGRSRRFEPRLTAELHRRWPGSRREVLGHDEARAWLLTADAGDADRVSPARPVRPVARRPAAATRSSSAARPGTSREHLAHGVPDLRLERCRRPLRGARSAATCRSRRDELRALPGVRAAASRRSCARARAGSTRSTTVQHDDLHVRSVYVDGDDAARPRLGRRLDRPPVRVARGHVPVPRAAQRPRRRDA